MIKTVWLVVVGTMSLVSIIVPSSVFAATINCDQFVRSCVGTDAADTMIISKLRGDGSPFYTIDGKGGGDSIAANLVQKDNIGGGGIFRVEGGSGDDNISVRKSIVLNLVSLFGGDGSDKVTYSGTSPALGLSLAQNDNSNNPDGKKDTLNCGNAANSGAHISLEDGDVAVNCNIVNTQPNN